MTGSVWVLAEQWRGKIPDITYETLALGRDLADEAQTRLEAVLIGTGVRSLACKLGTADTVLCVDHPRLAQPVAAMYVDVLGPLLVERRPSAFLIPLTNISLGTGTLLSGLLRLPAVNFCKDVHFRDGRFQARCLMYGGKVEAQVAVSGEPAVLGIWPGTRPAENGLSARAPEVEEIEVFPDEEPAVRFRRYLEPEKGDIDLKKQQVLVAVGRGLQAQENVALAESLAKMLGGAVCGSRFAADHGWLPLSRRVGKSGMTVKPKLYIALGISGSPEHLEGMRKSECIIAVNTDAHAPIFDIAHYGVVADAVKLLPALNDAIQAKRLQGGGPDELCHLGLGDVTVGA